MHEPTDARFWYLDNGKALCELCPRQCSLSEGQTGVCGVREFSGGRLLSTVYGRPASMHVDPIEKKPLYHFLPGSRVFSFGTVGCNMHCRCCQNASLSCETSSNGLDFIHPARIAELADRDQCESVAFTYNDPTVFAEYALDCAAACHDRGIATVSVTAGYIAPKARRALYEHIDAANVDLKCFDDKGYEWLASGARLAPVLETLEELVQLGVWLEVTSLIIPGFNDGDDAMQKQARWMADHLGPHVPLHLSAFHPDYRLKDRSRTPLDTLVRLRSIARCEGLHFVYTGNISHPDSATTSCPRCAKPLLLRSWHAVLGNVLDSQGCCSGCGFRIAGVFDANASRHRTRHLESAQHKEGTR